MTTPHQRLISPQQKRRHSPCWMRPRNTMPITVFTPEPWTVLTGADLPPVRVRHGYLYSAAGWVYRSDTCVEREKQLHGWILKENREYQKESDEFKQECVAGYRNYQLQSGDFPRDPQTQHDIERWAYFESHTWPWSLRRCPVVGKRNQEMSTNGICRWGRRGAVVVW